MTFSLPLAIKARFEASLVRIAIRILRGRNRTRARVVSRADNNLMWGMSEQLEDVAKRMASGYEEVKL